MKKTVKGSMRYSEPAKQFSEALPIGSGSFGAMVYGGFPMEKISLNSDTLWSGYPDCKLPAKPYDEEFWNKLRNQIWHGDSYKAQKEMQKHVLGEWNESYIEMGTLYIQSPKWSGSTPDHYERGLDLDRALVKSKATFGEKEFTSTSFLSFANHGMVILLETKNEKADFKIYMESQNKFQLKGKEKALYLEGIAPSYVEPNYVLHDNPIRYSKDKEGIRFCTGVYIHETDGELIIHNKEEEASYIEIKNSTRTVLFVAEDNGYRGYNQPLEKSEDLIRSWCDKKREEIRNESFEQLLEAHVDGYGKLAERASFSLMAGKEEKDLTMKEKLEKIKSGQEVPSLYENLFDFGRYLLISSSYPEYPWSQPANLQGIWCEEIRSIWSSNWTTNINLEMNYWLAGPGNLTECNEAFISLMEDLCEAGKDTARSLGCRGFCVNHNVDLWRHTRAVGGDVKYAFWPLGGVWLTTHLYEHYLFTGDLKYLRERAYPIIREAVLFCIDWLWEGPDGNLHTNPSTSPENTYLDKEGNECAVTYSSTMDITLIRELFKNYLNTCKDLGEEDELISCVEESLLKLPQYQINEKGLINEWIEDFKEFDEGHRHFAHLLGLHPFWDILDEGRKDLVDAAKGSIEKRIESHRTLIGWNCAWLVNFYARLRDGENAERFLNQFLSDTVYSNLFSLHPPLGEGPGEKEIFQIDGNLGVTAGIIEMLVQSNEKTICLLPALPEKWTDGYMEGIKTRQGHTVSVYWSKGNLDKLIVEASKDSELRIESKHSLTLTKDKDSNLVKNQEKDGKWVTTLPVTADFVYTFTVLEG